MTRRDWITAAAAAAATPSILKAAPTSPVAVARCRSYGSELVPAMERVFDQLGGLGSLVKGKTVAIKVNLTGSYDYRLGHTPAEDAHWTHPAVIGATIRCLDEAGARRVRILECGWSTAEPLEELMLGAGWEPRDMLNAGSRVEMENTNWLGPAKKYYSFKPANGGHLFNEYLLNHSYEDCDVFVSIAKMKEHATAGITLSMKNLFGITPCTIYGDGSAGKDEPLTLPVGGRGTVFHRGKQQPAKIAPPEKRPGHSSDGGWRVPRAVADLCSARPVHLAIVDGIRTMSCGEGPWIRGSLPIAPGLLFAGFNCVTTDAVGTALMGYDPMADRGTAPFQTSDNTMRLGEELGIGTRDLKNIEVRGLSIAEGRFEFAKHRAKS